MNLVLSTERLTIRPYGTEDGPDIERWAGDRDVAKTTLNMPHPYPEGAAAAWIAGHAALIEAGSRYPFAIVRRTDNAFIGGIGLHVNQAQNHAELAYWIAKPQWGQGYCTEAARRVIAFGFDELGLNRVFAAAFRTNPASSKVMKKAGMRYEGTLRSHVLKWGSYEDLDYYGIVKGDPRPQ